MAFSAEENVAIRETLLREARRCAVTLGLRKTSVEQLTEAAGISKGLFYKYFASKELLFFEVLEDIHSEVYQVAEQALEEGKDLPPDERIANVLLTACSRLSEIGAMKFIEEDSAYLLRRIPAQVKAEHYHSDEVHIRDLLEESGLTPRGGIALAAATIRGLILTMLYSLTPTLIREGRVFIAETPLYEINTKTDTYFAYSDKEKTAILNEIGDVRYTIQRSKGLGENDPEMMSLTTMNPATRRLVKVEPEDEAATEWMFDVLLGDNLAGRKEFIADRGSLYLDMVDVS